MAYCDSILGLQQNRNAFWSCERGNTSFLVSVYRTHASVQKSDRMPPMRYWFCGPVRYTSPIRGDGQPARPSVGYRLRIKPKRPL
jgi:hypothetical protein